MISDRRDDLAEHPVSLNGLLVPIKDAGGDIPVGHCQAEAPAVADVGRFHHCGCSPYLCEVCNPRRSREPTRTAKVIPLIRGSASL